MGRLCRLLTVERAGREFNPIADAAVRRYYGLVTGGEGRWGLWIVYVDADACPVKGEVFQVAERYQFRVTLVANGGMRAPIGPRVELVLKTGFGEVDDYIAERVEPGDIVITSDIPLAGRCLTAGAQVVDPRGRRITDDEIGHLLGMRDLMDTLRQSGQVTGGAPPMGPKDKSRFRSTLDQVINEVRRRHPSAE